MFSLELGLNVFTGVLLLVDWFVCEQDYTKTTQNYHKTWLKVVAWVGEGPITFWCRLDKVADPFS